MNDLHIKNQINNIIKKNDPESYALACAWILGNLKGINLKILEMSKVNPIADYFVLVSATNTTQAQSMADAIITQLKTYDLKVLSKEGDQSSDWILVDLGTIIVHIFLERARSIYHLDEIWKDAIQVQIPQTYYFTSEEKEIL